MGVEEGVDILTLKYKFCVCMSRRAPKVDFAAAVRTWQSTAMPSSNLFAAVSEVECMFLEPS